MKIVVLLLVLAGLFFVLGARRNRPREPQAPAPTPPSAPQHMVSCAECGMHLPADEALPGKGGVFCSSAHRASFEARQGSA
ncbi:PP0621 family protein [Roseateles puraquae]|jgi:uncharacterized protein|uniref:Deaminase n=1 Tax=Roseateles puraquae TaxID=431059 RepID=A0A254NIS5_9BURK|nr:PP0621 family protein [Roseateles puraquae]MDG0857435.1 hypothetical protein [Roseateles puraquae]OWR05947.1 hypothetical protein CDO81_05780 [Roseateles puraquae]GHT89535.1 hypothetical protein FACS1894101_0150 [Betaproteobacteria bacterium]